MNAERLLAYYERISDAPDAIARLRRFILDLAVRGKLVPQNRKDEPASELLKRIAAEKARLLKAGEIRNPKSTSAVSEPPFPIPANWRWSQIAEVGVLNPRNEAPDDTRASFVPMPLIPAEYGAANDHEVRPWGEIKKGYTHFSEGDVGLAKITPCFENGKSTVLRNLTGGIGSGTTELHVVRPVFVDQDYILIFFKSPHFIETGISKMTGTAGQKRVPTEYFAHSPFPVPPLAEQHRIARKVDELMALCDQIEAAREAREATRDRLTAASLARLNEPDPNTFQGDARFALDALAAITARPDQIKQLRQTILSLAVRGKLVPQDPKDEPAARVLERIDRVPKRAMRKRATDDDEDDTAFELEPLFELPDGWEWTQFGRLPLQASVGIDRGRSLQGPDKAFAYFKMNNIRNSGGIDLSDLIRIDATLDEVEAFTLEDGDFLFNTRNSRELVGKTCVFRPPSKDPVLYNNNILRVKFFEECSPDLLDYWFRSPDGIAELEKLKSNTTNVCAIYQGKLSGFRCPIPPVAEQNRIVAKVDELMSLCDRLEASLAAGNETRSRLLNSLLAEVLAPADGARPAEELDLAVHG